jgi:hypothetical protein
MFLPVAISCSFQWFMAILKQKLVELKFGKISAP